MNQKPWWEKWPGRRERELNDLTAAGIPYELDEAALGAGVFRLRIWPVVDDRSLPLVATFPDYYPYFRFEVAAPGEQLPYHQHPMSKNLCLLGRATHYWDTDLTLARVIQSQLGTILETAVTADLATLAGKEQQQAEPFGDYYPYAISMILVQDNWTIPTAERSGFLVIGSQTDVLDAGTFSHGAVLRVLNNSRRVLGVADREILGLYSASTLSARWVRVDEPIHIFDQVAFFNHVKRLDPGAKNNPPQRFSDGLLQIWGVAFPEEVAWRKSGEGWMFACQFESARRAAVGRSKLIPQWAKHDKRRRS